MMNAVLTLPLLFLIYIASRQTHTLVFSLTHHTSGSKMVAVSLLSLLLYPGTVVHELAHLLTALILFVPIEKLELEPKVEKGYIRAGSVTTRATDIFRQSLISISPLPVGMFILWLIQTEFLRIDFSLFSFDDVFTSLPSPAVTTASLFALFSISSSMFPSSTDVRLAGTIPLIVAAFVISGAIVLFLPPVVPILQSLILPFLLHIIVLVVVFGIRHVI